MRIIEAEIPVCAPVAGTVAVSSVEPEDEVNEGDHLAELA